MTRSNILKIIAGIVLIISGLLAILIGFVVALIAGAEWLLLCLGGLVFIILGGAIIGSELKRIIRMIKQIFDPNTKTRIKR